MKENREAREQLLIDYAFTHSFDDSVQLILEKTAAELNSTKGMLVVLEEEESTIHVVATYGERAPSAGPSDEPPPVSFSGKPDGNDWFECFAETRTIIHAETCRSPEWPFFGSDTATVPTALYVPFMTPVRARAAFAFFGRSAPFSQEDRRVVEQISFLPLRVAFEERRLFALLEMRTIYDSVADVLFTLSVESDEVFRFTSVNRSFLETTGLSRDSVIGKDFREVIPPESQELVLSKYREAVDEGRTVRWEEVSEYAAGIRYGEVSVKPIVDSHGRCTHLIGTVHDVTAYRNAQQELQSANDKYQTFFDNSMDAIVLLSPGGEFLEVNKAAAEMFGRTQSELLSGGRSMVADESDPNIAALIEQRRKTGRSQGEIQLRRADGTVFPAEISSSVFKDSRGHLRIGMVVRDISERVAAQEEIERSERYFRALIENAADIIMVLSPDGEVRYCSPSVKRQLGHDPELLLGAKIGELEIFQMDSAAEDTLELVMRQEGASLPITLTATTSSGNVRYLSGAARNAAVEESVGGIVVNLRDVTSNRRSEEERELLRDELEQARKMESVGRLAGGVAHDFNNQLTVIMGHVELMLARVSLDEANREDLAAIKTAAMRSADLTRQLLAFARRQSISPRLLELNKAVDGMIRMLRRLIGENIELVWEPGSDISAVKLDPVQIDQILANLCLNARDAIEDSGQIRIKTRRARLDSEGNEVSEGGETVEYVMLSVSDNGIGMDAETLSHIFEPFFTTKAQGKGTGLGAATVYGIVQQNHGRIKVESEPGSGSEFKLYFPAYQGTVAATDRQEETASTFGRGETILLVEDDRSILGSTSRVLESIGYNVISFADPEEAVRFVNGNSRELDLIITDVIMPKMNGKELVDRISSIRSNVKSLYVSGYTADVIGIQGVLDGAVNFLEKPYRFDDLAGKIRVILADGSR